MYGTFDICRTTAFGRKGKHQTSTGVSDLVDRNVHTALHFTSYPQLSALLPEPAIMSELALEVPSEQPLDLETLGTFDFDRVLSESTACRCTHHRCR